MFDAVVDYYAMKPDHVQDVIAAFLKSDKPLQSYIFISTNMVYLGGPGNMDISPLRPLVQETAADITNAESAPDDYGGLKLKCERILLDAWIEHQFPFTVIRPPSVIGPTCDNRHEALQRVAMGLNAGEQRTRPLAECPEGGFRLAFSEDVANFCVEILSAPVEAVRGEAFNIAMEESVSLEEYLAACRDAVSPSVSADWPTKAEALATLTSLGPNYRSYEGQSCLDISKACAALSWQPTSFAEAMKATVGWHTPLLEGTR